MRLRYYIFIFVTIFGLVSCDAKRGQVNPLPEPLAEPEKPATDTDKKVDNTEPTPSVEPKITEPKVDTLPVDNNGQNPQASVPPLVENDRNLIGDWSSECKNDAEQGRYVRVKHKISDGAVLTTVEVFTTDDAPCMDPWFDITVNSTYKTSTSSLGSGIQNIDFKLTTLLMTIRNEAELFQSNQQNGRRGRCLVRWSLGVPVELTALTAEQKAKCGGSLDPRMIEVGSTLPDIYRVDSSTLQFGLDFDKLATSGGDSHAINRPETLNQTIYKKERP